jgi:AcrR family transcriptional regulator
MDVGALADEMGIGKGTIYRYFPRKAELFLAAVDRAMRLMDQAVSSATSDEPDGLRRLEIGIETYLEFFHQHREFVELIVQERAEFRDRRRPTYFQHRDVVIQKWRVMYAGLMAAGRIRTMPLDQVTDVLSHLAFGTMFSNFFAGRQKTSREQALEILDVVFNGILMPRAGARPSGDES